jgi:hypothetical protein
MKEREKEKRGAFIVVYKKKEKNINHENICVHITIYN